MLDESPIGSVMHADCECQAGRAYGLPVRVVTGNELGLGSKKVETFVMVILE